jgi:hypothetical protein
MKYKDTKVKVKTRKIIGVRYVAKNGDAADDNTRMILVMVSMVSLLMLLEHWATSISKLDLCLAVDCKGVD